jgi:heavy metal sensor kinase
MTPDWADLQRLAWRMGATGCAVLVLGLLCGWWLATRAIQPIAGISLAANSIAAGKLDERIDISDTDSELGQLAQVLNTTFHRLQAAFARQTDFTANASHELRTPVSVVLSQTQTILMRERTPVEYRECIEACQRAAQRMRQLIDSLLLLARLDSPDHSADREPCDLAQMVTEAIEMLRPLSAERNVTFRSDLAPTGCVGDPGQLCQAIINLITNAIYYNRVGGEVHVKVGLEDDGAMLVVSDTGTGIAPGDLPHVFERFYRADKARSHSKGRTGLGLAITKAIVDAHRGTIQVESEVGKGSTFTLHLPR